MNPAATSREAILAECRKLVMQGGLQAISMRSVAEACGVALGSLYNYFPSKAALVEATVQSVWEDVFHLDEAPGGQGFLAALRWLDERLREAAARYPGFVTLHAMSFAAGDRPAGRQRMEGFFDRIKAFLAQSLLGDPALSPSALQPPLTAASLVNLCFASLVAMRLEGREDMDALLRLLQLALYPEYTPTPSKN